MHTFESSVRTRYWRETTREFFHNHPIAAPAVIFILAMGGIVVCRQPLPAIIIAFLAVYFAKPFLREIASQNPPPLPRQPAAFAPPRPPGAESAEVARLLAALERMEQRVIQLESVVTAKEFDWERRLNQTPPPISKAASEAVS